MKHSKHRNYMHLQVRKLLRKLFNNKDRTGPAQLAQLVGHDISLFFIVLLEESRGSLGTNTRLDWIFRNNDWWLIILPDIQDSRRRRRPVVFILLPIFLLMPAPPPWLFEPAANTDLISALRPEAERLLHFSCLLLCLCFSHCRFLAVKKSSLLISKTDKITIFQEKKSEKSWSE